MKKNHLPLLRPAMSLFCLTALLGTNASANTYQVTNLNDNGTGTLRQAIINANANAGADTITFSTNGVITLSSILPLITSPVAINGYSAPNVIQGSIGARSIKMSVDAGNTASLLNSGGRSVPDGLFRFTTGSSGSSLSGLAIYNTVLGSEAVIIEDGISNIHIWGNYFGLNASGVASTATVLRDAAIFIGNYTAASPAAISNVYIGTNGDGINDAREGNAIANANTADGGNGVSIGSFNNRQAVSSVKIAGNYIGIASDGFTAAPMGTTNAADANSQGFDGIIMVNVDGTNMVIGSDGNGVSDSLEYNLISGNAGNGIEINSSNGISIAGNLVGTDKAGNAPVPNGGKSQQNGTYYAGIALRVTSSGSLAKLPCHDIVIGFDDSKHLAASAPYVRNVVSQNQAVGIDIYGTTVSNGLHNNIRIAGNYIGISKSGTLLGGNGVGATATGFGGHGIAVQDATAITIGTNSNGSSDSLEGNFISDASFGRGINITKGVSAVTNSVIAGNKIGLLANGNAQGNEGPGIVVDSATDIRIGSNDDGVSDDIEANIIANNAYGFTGTSSDGLRITGNSTRIRVSRNSFYNNKGNPIDLGNDGVSPNDGVTTANQPNLMLDYPVLKSYSVAGSTVTVAGYVSDCNGIDTAAGPAIPGLKTIQFYKSDNTGDQNGLVTASCSSVGSVAHGEGQQYLGSITGVTNTFNTSFTLVAGATFTASDKLTAIAIDANGNTSEFGATAPPPAPLGIDLKAFTAVPNGNTALLHWTTASEHNNKGFHVERSADGSHWSEIGFVATAADGGNSTADLKYAFTDYEPLTGFNYFRLKQEDFDGKTKLSETRIVRFDDGGTDLVVYPNPATSRLNVLLPQDWLNKPVDMMLLNQLGQAVLQLQFNAAQATENMTVKSLPAGIYILKAQQGAEARYRKVQIIP